ncbi:MAG: ATP-binding protein [Candidatus Thorarchaeota archaeon]
MIDEAKLVVNILLFIYALSVTIVFWFTWRKRPDMAYWFFALIIYTISHVFLIFRQHSVIIRYIGNAVQLIALLVVVFSSFAEYITIMIKSQKNKDILSREKNIFYITITISFILCASVLVLFQTLLYWDILLSILFVMIGLLIPLDIFVLRIYIKQRTITRLFMFIVFAVGVFTAASTILTLFFDWGERVNDAMNFIFITFIMTAGLAAPIEQRIQNSEENYKKLSEHLEEKVGERTLQLELANKELESFSYSVSHDLRTPLRSIAGFGKALQEDFSESLDDNGKVFLERILHNTNRMNDLINDLLNLSRITRSEIKTEVINLSIISQEIINNLKSVYSDKEINFDIQENNIARGDPSLIKIALENLLGNAVKFSITKSKPHISFGSLIENNETVYFVKDNGIGFDMKYYDKLFGLFQRLHSTEDYEGTGIGLITVKRIIDRHQGRIWADSEVNLGTTFFFTLG